MMTNRLRQIIDKHRTYYSCQGKYPAKGKHKKKPIEE